MTAAIGVLINLIIWLIILGIIWFVIDAILKAFPIPDPPGRLIRIGVTALVALFALLLVLNLLGVATPVAVPKVVP